jgi:hypothetical protein
MREGVHRLYGLYSTADRPARFTIRTPAGPKYFVKIETTFDKSPAMSFLVYGGSSLDVDMPLGTFVLKYASGNMWCGERDLFGSDTTFFRARDTFTFERNLEADGYSTSHWTVELIPQRRGNLQTMPISRSEF